MVVTVASSLVEVGPSWWISVLHMSCQMGAPAEVFHKLEVGVDLGGVGTKLTLPLGVASST